RRRRLYAYPEAWFMFAAITLSLQLQRTSFDLLDGLSIEVAVHNSTQRPVDVHFAGPLEYAIDVLRNGNAVWTSVPPASEHPFAIPPHEKRLLPGPSVLGVYIWNEETRENASISPGDYTVRVRLLGQNAAPTATTNVRFISPTPVSALRALHVGDAVTIAGRYDVASQTITDATGSVRLTKKLLGAPVTEPTAVRGYITALSDRSRVFFVSRWARMTPI
ncbi:MAG: hypothetical protein M3N13_09450, partial [Candidatus Eremiobacteraeota bacterium]|nr:hypothetical protein [Candidatus Eremiobacteraeota bacterium]